MDFLATPRRRKLLFGLLYLSEGAPVGFIWLGLPTRLRTLELPVQQITWLMAALILPWTLKFLWAPLVDLLRGNHWGFKHWILVSQSLMALSLLPLIWLDIQTQFSQMAGWLLLHAFCAATQDLSIDALCVEQSRPDERTSLNGWMQCGVLVGRAAMGGGALVLEQWVGFSAVVGILIGIILMSAILLCFASEKSNTAAEASAAKEHGFTQRLQLMFREQLRAIRSGGIWAGLLFACFAPAAFKSLEAVLGPFLIDRGYSKIEVGEFSSTMMIGGMIVGSLLAGYRAKRFSSTQFLVTALTINLLVVASLAASDIFMQQQKGMHLLVLLSLVAISIGWFTVAMYSWLMNMTTPGLAATQFTAFMAATNACEAWSTSLLGSLQASVGYPYSILILCSISAVSAAAILKLHSRKN